MNLGIVQWIIPINFHAAITDLPYEACDIQYSAYASLQ